MTITIGPYSASPDPASAGWLLHGPDLPEPLSVSGLLDLAKTLLRRRALSASCPWQLGNSIDRLAGTAADVLLRTFTDQTTLAIGRFVITREAGGEFRAKDKATDSLVFFPGLKNALRHAVLETFRTAEGTVDYGEVDGELSGLAFQLLLDAVAKLDRRRKRRLQPA